MGLGAAVRVTGGEDDLKGIAEDIDDTGALLVRTSGGVTRVVAGDVHLVAPPA